MAKASTTLNPAHREVVQNALVDLVRRAIRHGVAYGNLGTELMAQGYAILTGKDVAAARGDVLAMMGRGGVKKPKASASKRTGKKTAAKGGAKKGKSGAKGRSAKRKASR
jgi:hypothetical protein